MIIIFIGPPFSGKDTQSKLLGKELNLPVFSMGALIRDAYERKDPKGVMGFEQYSMKGFHVPIKLKFDLLKEKMDKSGSGFILDNFPGNQEDLDAFNDYVSQKNLTIDKVLLINISKEEMFRRMKHRGRDDDNPEVIIKRREIQDLDRMPVIEYFKNQGLLREINGEGEIGDIHKQIMENLK